MTDSQPGEISEAEFQRLMAEHRQWESLSPDEQQQAREIADTLRRQGAPDPNLAAVMQVIARRPFDMAKWQAERIAALCDEQKARFDALVQRLRALGAADPQT